MTGTGTDAPVALRQALWVPDLNAHASPRLTARRLGSATRTLRFARGLLSGNGGQVQHQAGPA